MIGSLSPAYEVGDFQVIAVVEGCPWPLCARNDVAVELDGDSIAFHAELFDELGQGERSGKRLLFAIDGKAHTDSFKF